MKILNKQSPNKERREFLRKTGKAGMAALAAPSVTLLVSALNPQLALGYGRGGVESTAPVQAPTDLFWGDAIKQPWTKPEYGDAIEIFKGPDGKYDASDGNSNNYYDKGTNDNTKISTNDSTSASHQDDNENHGNRNSSSHLGGYVSVGDSGDSSSDSSRSSGGSDPVGDLAGSDSSLRSASNGSGSGSHNLAGHNGSSSNSRKSSSGGGGGGDTTSVDAGKNIFIRPHQEKVVLFLAHLKELIQ